MSLYQVQKLLYRLNRDPTVQQQYHANRLLLLDQYPLTDEERRAFESQDIGLLYVLGANGQLLMHYAAFLAMPWPDYIAAMREGVARHGPVRAGVYCMTTSLDDKVAGT